MAANWELQLLSAIVRGEAGTPAELFERAQVLGVRHEWFGQLEAKSVWARVAAHYSRPTNFGHIPSEDALAALFPSLELPDCTDNFEDLCALVREGYLKRRSDALVSAFQQESHEDIVSALESLHAKLGSLKEQVVASDDASFKDVAMDIVIRTIENAKSGNGMTGLPWPWAKLNEETGGIHPQDFILVWALPKSMKTFWGLIVSAYLLSLGYKVLVYSKEMTLEIVILRLAAILAKVDYTKLKKGKLSQYEEETLLETVHMISETSFSGNLFFTNANRLDGSAGGPAEITKKIETYNPDFVLLDSSYMLEMPDMDGSPLDWKNLAALTRALKQVCMAKHVPMMAILQESETQAFKYKNSRGTASLAMNKGAVMDCDLGINLVMHKKRKELSIRFSAGRELLADGFTIHAQACENFDYAHDHIHQVGDDGEDEDEEATAVIAASACTTALSQLDKLIRAGCPDDPLGPNDFEVPPV